MTRVLLVEDEKVLAKNIAFFLEKEGFSVDIAHDGERGLALFQQGAYDIALLDWTLPRMDGLELCRILRGQSSVPIIMITAKDELVDKVVGLEVGADDYVTKPFHTRELLARMRALLRRSGRNANEASGPAPAHPVHSPVDHDHLTWNGLILDRHRLCLQYRDAAVPLAATEFKLLDLFMRYPQNVFSREQLFDTVWGMAEGYSDRTVDVNISRLRRKIADLSGLKVLFAVRGIGYKFEESP